MNKMKIHPTSITFLLAFLFLPFLSIAQTINTTVSSTGYTGTNNSGTGSWSTFTIENGSGAPINITSIGGWSNSSQNGATYTLWYSTSSLSGTVGTLTGPTWTSMHLIQLVVSDRLQWLSIR
ncbi:MAG: hypothetical protein EOP56_12775 [Sphingobacteriales bacterium]|nr:MAG: hypothetical protein EOP56_12775 [Sphingobacteriales bacterium]